MRRSAEKDSLKDEIKPKELYLLGYNSFQTLGWSYIAFLSVTRLLNRTDELTLFERVFLSLALFQSLAILEVVHAFVGLVRSSPFIAAFQVASRVFVLWGVVVIAPEVQNSIGFLLLLIAWTITEVVRYSFYCTTILDITPQFLVYLRYTLFYVLYPLGVTGELLCIYNVLGPVYRNSSFSYKLPNPFNIHFDYYYILHIVFVMYILFFPQMFQHMVKQRKKVLGPVSHLKSQ